MLFNSFAYFVFFALVIPFYFILPAQNYRRLLLIAGSCFFYMYFIPQYILILFLVISIDFFSGIAIEKHSSKKKKKIFLLISIFSNLGILFFFKYCNFFIGQVEWISGQDLPRLAWLLPIGLSFHTFQSLSYVIEVYRGNFKAEKKPDVFALYVLFFPQLVAGPIERPQHVIPQLKELKTFDLSRFISGLALISIGLIKKSVLADRLALYVDPVYADVGGASWLSMASALVFFSLQIYFDFSGYSDIARGSARCLGIDLMQNFNPPYSAASLREFWTRWHISLSTWFRDYVYIPLGGNKKGRLIHFRNLLVVFSLSGLWHGANWTFVIWGVLHGLLLWFSSALNWQFVSLGKNMRILDQLFNFALITLLWVFFRAPDLATATQVFQKLFDFNTAVRATFIRQNFGFFSAFVVLVSCLYLWAVGKRSLQLTPASSLRTQTFLVTLNFLFVASLGIFYDQSFIYFQF